ncbi:MAG: D-alanyl-D-alanine carboxypeptidase, partial [Kiritimatiellae bacterium]|nr:D-alanyl-D-alanine carboxypeptidase [Kiritimatiellia bacterium]
HADRRQMKKAAATALCVLCAAVCAPAAQPRQKARPAARQTAAAKPPQPVQSAHRRSPYVGALSANAASGEVLFADRADVEAYPASVTKLMTALLVLEDIEAKKYAFDTRVTATDEVYKSEPSIVGLKAGQSMTVDDLLMALMVKSANDAAIALGVNSAGSLDAFVDRMNQRAAELGMKNTRYYNPNGLPPKSKYGTKAFNVTTCSDQLKLARRILTMPRILRYTSTKIGEVTDGYGKPLRFVNHNNVMVKNKRKVLNPDGTEAVDGLKTGYIDAGGSSVVLTGRRNGKRAIVIVLGSASAKERDENAARLLEDALGAISW